MTWLAGVKSTCGKKHVTNNISCQDFGLVKALSDEKVIGVISDGAGCALHAKEGARLACETSVEFLTKHQKFFEDVLTNEKISTIFQNLVAEIRQKLKKKKDLKSYAATLLIFVATKQGVATLQIGDGFIVIKSKDNSYQLACVPQQENYINATSFITDEDVLDSMQTKWHEGETSFVCMATDGLEPVALYYPSKKPFENFFKSFDSYIQKAKNQLEIEEELKRFLESERLNLRCDDDKTLLLCGWQDAA